MLRQGVYLQEWMDPRWSQSERALAILFWMNLAMWLLLVLLVVTVVLAAAYAGSAANRARRSATSAFTKVEGLSKSLQDVKAKIAENVALAARNHVVGVQALRLRSIEVEELKRHASGLRLQALKDAGLKTLADLQSWPASRLTQLRGLGPESAARIANVAGALIAQTNQRPIPRPGVSEGPGQGGQLLGAICLYRQVEEHLKDPNGSLPSLVENFTSRRNAIIAKTSFLLWIRGFGKNPTILEGIQESKLMVQDLEATASPAQIFLDFSNRVEEVTSYIRKGPAWATVVHG